jgi:hypothetical protein
MNTLDKIDIVCTRIKEMQILLHQLHDECNEPGLAADIQRERYLKVEAMQANIDMLNGIKNDLFKEAGID